MLILLRKPGQTIMIGDEISVSVLGIQRFNQVRVGIDAPKHIDIIRKELYEKIQQLAEDEKKSLRLKKKVFIHPKDDE